MFLSLFKKLFCFFVLSALITGFFLFVISNPKEINKIFSSASLAEISKEDNQKPEEKIKYLIDFYSLTEQEFISQEKDFIEINLSEEKAQVYKQGIMEKEIDILTQGNPQEWGGTPVGLYEVLSGNKIGFSNISQVYMPWALHFYGKYYIHGEPYYSNGTKMESDYSGGCIRFTDKDAEYIFKATEIGIPMLIIDKQSLSSEIVGGPASHNLEVSAESFLVADLDNYQVLAEKNSSQVLPIASLSKLMTAIIAIEHNNLKNSIWTTEDMLTALGSTPGLEANKKYNLVELLHPLLTQSSNDAAEILTRFLGREKTINLMNEKTKTIGMKNTFFEDPSGLSPNNVSTTEDLFYLTRYIFNVRPPILEITKGEIIEDFGTVHFEDLHNKNIFPESQDFLGGKTGFIVESKNTGIFIFKMPLSDNTSRNIVIILLKSKSPKTDVEKIITWWFENIFLQ